jgi:hypothetical protein
MLSGADRREALAVMERVMRHPIAITFHDPISPEDCPDADLSPIGLTTVCERLRAAHYRTVHSWLADVETVIHNYELSSSNPFELAAASEVRRCFTKERAKMHRRTASFWLLSVANSRARMAWLNTHVPPKLRAHMVPLAIVDVPKLQYFPMSEHEIQETLNGTELLRAEQVGGLAGAIAAPGAAITSAAVDESNAQKIKEYIDACVSGKGQ